MRCLRLKLIYALILSVPLFGAQADEQDKIDLATWDQSVAYKGWRAQDLLDAVAYGKNAELVGEIENLYVDRDGMVTKVIIESGGLFDVGDLHLSVPWDQVTAWITETDGIVVPIDDDNVSDFSLFQDDPQPGIVEWRATDLIGDHVYLADDRGFGVVEDFIFDRTGAIQAIIVRPGVGNRMRDPIAYPWRGLDYEPLKARIDLQVERREIEALGPFDYDALELDRDEVSTGE